MRQKCYNPSGKDFKYYGGRGIFICAAWKDSYETFHAWCEKTYVDGLTLDRKNNDGSYSPKNCRWVDRSEQAKNRDNTGSKNNLKKARRIQKESRRAS
jgi:hypothetical protein